MCWLSLNFTKLLFKYEFANFIILQTRFECLLKIPQELAIKLKSQLEEMRKNKELQEAEVKGSGPGERAEEMVVLTRSDASGNVWPLEMTERQEPRGGRKKRKKVKR